MNKNDRLDSEAAKIKFLLLQGRQPEAITALMKLVESVKTKPRGKNEDTGGK